MKKFVPRYSGTASTAFWKAINKIGGREGELMYALGCALQNIEYSLLHDLNGQKQGKVKKRKPKTKGAEHVE